MPRIEGYREERALEWNTLVDREDSGVIKLIKERRIGRKREL